MNDFASTLTIGEQIGAGHFGRVYRGNDATRELLAIKVMDRLPHETDLQWQNRKAGLVAEGASLARATHRNVVHVHYVTNSVDGNSVHLVMEFCAGGSLERTYKENPLNASLVRKIAKETSSGMASLHDRGMVHRDIKPGNILLDSNGCAKIGDFGLVTDDLVEGYTDAVGYRDHLAPEYYETRLCSLKSDIWALGVTLYRLLHGDYWYRQSERPRDVVALGGFAQKLKWLPHVSDEWRRVIRRMLSDDPHSRPTHMRDVSRLIGSIDVSNPWDCEIIDGDIFWRRHYKSRIQTVNLLRKSDRIYSWSALSSPANGQGRNKSLGSNDRCSFSQANKELRIFFNKP